MTDCWNTDWSAFLGDLSNLVSELEQSRSEYGCDEAGLYLTKLNFSVQTLTCLLRDLCENCAAFRTIEAITFNMLIIKQEIQRYCLSHPPRSQELAVYTFQPTFERTGRRGRPKVNISEEALLYLRSLGHSWTDIASLLLVSRMTIFRKVRELGIESKCGYTELSDADLDEILRTFKRDHGMNCGRSMAIGYLRSRGIRVQQRRIAESLVRIDPSSSRLRWAAILYRRTYSVPGPNSLWHIDGHHSLVQWGFVIHGAIDGFSRLIVFLQCSTNNWKESVLDLFNVAVEKWGVPSRVRTDKGGENVLVWSRMEELRGTGRGSFLAGSSVHNQRIERLWRDVWNSVACEFYYTFQALQADGLLECDNDIHKYVLHYVFLPRINRVVGSFVESWNNHPLRTQRNWSPHRLWVNGMIDHRHMDVLQVREFRLLEDIPDNLQWYGMDHTAPCPSDDGLSYVEVNSVDSPLTAEQEVALRNNIDPLEQSNTFGIDIFQRALRSIAA